MDDDAAAGIGVLVIALVVVAFVLGRRIRKLDQRVAQLTGALAARIERLEGTDRDAAVLSGIRLTETAPAPSPPSQQVAEPPGAPEAAAQPTPPPAPDEAVPAAPPPPPAPPRQRFDWERFVGLRLPVWLGAIALSVAGFFFVSYAIESGFFTPEMRVLSAAAASVLFLAGAEFVRRRVRSGNVAAIASALAAASIATAYATAYLATKTYGLVPSGAGFIITIGVSIAAIAVALAYGEAVALIGIVGGYLAPAIYGGGEANAPFLVIYLTALSAVTYAVIRFRSWWRLSFVGLIGPAFWGLVWVSSATLRHDYVWGSIFLIALPLIVAVASWPGWQEDGPVIGLRGFTAMRTPERGSLVGATILAAFGFAVFLDSSDYAIGYWQGLIVFAAATIALGFVSPPHRALQLPILIASGVALLLWRNVDPVAGFIVTGLLAVVFGFGALDQFRRMREPGLWAGVHAIVAVFMFSVALFKVEGWGDAIANRHLWALGALALAAGFIVLLRLFAERVEGELERSQVYAAWGGAVTTLVSLAVVLELDPLYFPAAAALAILGLAAVHMRAPVRGLRIVAAIYLAIYGLLLLGAFSYADGLAYTPEYMSYVFVRDASDHALALLVIPGIALLAAGTMFQISRPAETKSLVAVIDIVAIIAEAIGLFYLLALPYGNSRWSDTLVLAARIAAPELAVAAVAVYVGRRFDRQAAYTGGIILTGVTVLAMLAVLILPLLQFWPPYAVPGTVIINVTLVAYGVPALLLYFIGWYLRQETRRGIRLFGIAVSIFAVVVTYAMLMIDIRHAYNLGAPTLQGGMSQSEYYAYSIATLVFGLGLLIGGVAFKHRGARAVSFFFVLAATVKVFLFDASELTGLWRVLSFLLMGLSFLGISWAYARFVFGIGTRKEPPPAPAAPPPLESPEPPPVPQG
ncbi:MAG: DUF2339 domain-containing protein [Devosia sp.]|uniref:DUF2339 domain-containing protein n=1 Tax=Devosia sp. TaxID=1871048 RepID=UPI001A4E41DA|nr:DUF2339 domain-containing protein [Devosia sp.]MBL8599356.1 DUF2339 domain-containing protein [Devosia sp.]